MTRASVAVAALLLGCGGPGLDPDVEPVTEGDWVRPDRSTTWQWQLDGTIDTAYDVQLYDIDLFEAEQATIDALHEQGRTVICYFSAGSSETFRPDYDRFTGRDKGWKLDGWAGERWLDVRSPNVLAVMLDRLDLAVDKHCDGVEPDNMDGFLNRTGFRLSAANQLGFNRRLANEAHERGLSIALKNEGDQARELVDYYDFSLNEQCHQYDECGQLQPFLDADKPVLNVEYPGSEAKALARKDELCARAQAAGTTTLLMPLELDDRFRVACE